MRSNEVTWDLQGPAGERFCCLRDEGMNADGAEFFMCNFDPRPVPGNTVRFKDGTVRCFIEVRASGQDIVSYGFMKVLAP